MLIPGRKEGRIGMQETDGQGRGGKGRGRLGREGMGELGREELREVGMGKIKQRLMVIECTTDLSISAFEI